MPFHQAGLPGHELRRSFHLQRKNRPGEKEPGRYFERHCEMARGCLRCNAAGIPGQKRLRWTNGRYGCYCDNSHDGEEEKSVKLLSVVSYRFSVNTPTTDNVKQSKSE